MIIMAQRPRSTSRQTRQRVETIRKVARLASQRSFVPTGGRRLFHAEESSGMHTEAATSQS